LSIGKICGKKDDQKNNKTFHFKVESLV